jgi:hypothetical protein
MEGLEIYAVVKTCKVSCNTVEVYSILYTSQESAKNKALELYRSEEEPEKYDYRVEIYWLMN